jgi:hypothetical protein
LVFNGDFNWFDVAPDDVAALNRRVLAHTALRCTVETELTSNDGDAGCGCAYPDDVDAADVERSHAIMRRLQGTARLHPAIAARASALLAHVVAEVAGQRICIVHGDAESLAGFASSLTCLPVYRRFAKADATHFVANNGAAGMPNFGRTAHGLITRLSVPPPAEGVAQFGFRMGELFVDALPVFYDQEAFARRFLAAWPPGSPAHVSYWKRIEQGPAFVPAHALGLLRAATVCAGSAGTGAGCNASRHCTTDRSIHSSSNHATTRRGKAC